MKNRNSIWKIFFYLGLLIFTQMTFSQSATDSIAKNTADTTRTNNPKKLKFGCGFALGFVGGTNISLSPNLTYKLSDKLTIGTGIQGSYSAIKNLQNTITYGANILGQYNLSKKIQTLLEFAQLRVSTKTETETDKSTHKFWDSALFAGISYTVTPKISVGAKYNLLYKEGKSVYTSPVIPFVNIVF